MTPQTSGSAHPSGLVQATTRKRVSWKDLAHSLQLQVTKLEREVDNLRKENESLQKGWLKPREQNHLDVLSRFYTRIVNLQINDNHGEVKKKLDDMCEEVVGFIKKKDEMTP